MERGITAFGAYIPTLRIERAAIAAAHAWSHPALKGLAKGHRALPNWDEDAITMAVEAGRGLDRARVSRIAFASTTAPFADLQNATLVAAALGISPEIATGDHGGSLRAGTSALIAALRSNEDGETLVAVADARFAKPASVQEMNFGAGAVAFNVGRDDVIARVLGMATRADPFVDHFRATGEKHDYVWEERWIRDEGYLKIVPPLIAKLLADAGLHAGDVAHFCMAAPLKGLDTAVARKAGLAPEAVADNLALHCGDTGAAHSLLMLAATLEKAKPGERILVVTFGAGCDALLLEATPALSDYRPDRTVAAALANGRPEGHYLKLAAFQGEIDLDWGMRAEGSDKIALTQQYRARGQLAEFVGGACADCGTIQFPQLASCVNCGSFEPFTQVPLSELPAKVATYTADWLQYSPAPPFYFGLVQFENGARLLMEIVDVDPSALDVGTDLRMVFRIKSRDGERHYRSYFWKAAPLASQEN